LEEVRDACGDSTGVRLLPFDLADLDSLPAVVETALGCFGQVDVMVHNAGVATRDRVVNTTLEVHEQVLRTNYLGPVVITQALLPSMNMRGSGCFVVLSSLSGKYGVPLLAPYAASKHALHGFFESLRAEEHDRGIQVTLVVPGFIRTEITAHALTGSGDRYGKVLPTLGHAMHPDECARRILDAVARRKKEALIGGAEIWSVHLERWFPGAWSALVRRHPVRKLRRLLGWIPGLGRRWRVAPPPG
jgi:short-subunit dehydrogenase